MLGIAASASSWQSWGWRERGGWGDLCSWCYNLDSISRALLFQQIHSEAHVSMATREFSGALLLCLPPSALSVIAVNITPVRHSLLAASFVVFACPFVCVCVSVMGCYTRETSIKDCWAVNVYFSFRQTSFPFHISQSSKSPAFCFYLFICLCLPHVPHLLYLIAYSQERQGTGLKGDWANVSKRPRFKPRTSQ